ncbi:uncharacterized protein LOC118288766 isoform X2 [Scophthalmus maximus]|uniref:uncharacterized protein LOC118288766 isoform X2 n=1 Tax=Scophthalmus maximus TaxID=52904 RepID=UPI0015E09CAF|nr:uncharacterized protein LOC118288766 isoform X2 [Scophthalmus maximus]
MTSHSQSTKTQMHQHSYEVPQQDNEDPDAATPAVTDGSQCEVKVKPVPRPRSKILSKAQSNTSNTIAFVDKTGNTSNTVSAEHDEHSEERPRPVRPPPRPPIAKCLTSSKPTPDVDGDSLCGFAVSQYMSTNTEPTVTPPAVCTERNSNLPCPKRPPLPSIYYGRPLSMKGKQCKSYTEESQQYTISTMQKTPDSPASSVEEMDLCGTYGEMATDSTDRPAVPPRLSQSYLPRSASECETSPPQTRPPPPSFDPPPPPPSTWSLPESEYSEIEHRPYLDVLPEDEDKMTQRRSMPRSELRYQIGRFSSHQQIIGDTDDINGMLRWLTRVSKSDYMTPSLYGLSIEEEIRSFNQRAMNVSKALRLYNLVMMKRNESLRNVITEFNSISNSLDKMKKRTKTINIAGGTTGAVGGVTAVLGIALAPVTMGASLIATAVGAGMVASAGGMGAHTAKANKKSVDKMKVEKLVYEYKAGVVDLERCLDFILSGMNELRRHDIGRLHRAGAQPDALKMAHLAQSVYSNNMNKERRTSAAHPGGLPSEGLLLAFAKELDQYFTEDDGQKLKKSNKSRFSGRVRLLVGNLLDQLQYLNRMWEMFS